MRDSVNIRNADSRITDFDWISNSLDDFTKYMLFNKLLCGYLRQIEKCLRAAISQLY